MGASIRPDDHDRIAANVAKMRAGGASDAEVEQYLTQHEGLTPVSSGNVDLRAQSETTQARPRPKDDPRSLPKRIGDFVEGGTMAALNGATLGFMDDIAAGGAALASGHPVKAFESMRKQIDAPREQFAKDHGVANFAAEAAGGLLPLSRVAKGIGAGATLAGRVLRPIAEGAAIGGISGAGSASGGLAERGAGAVKGAVVGGLVGGAIPGAGKVGGVLLDATGARNTGAIKAASRVLPILDADSRAKQMIVTSMQRDGLSLEQAVAKAKMDLGFPTTIMDVAGENTKGLGRGAQSVPGRAKKDIADVLHAREQGASTRVKEALGDAMGVPREDAGAKASELVGKRAGNAKPKYDAAYLSTPIEDPDVLAIFADPAFQKAHAAGRRIAKLEGVDLPPLTKTSESGGESVTEQVAQSVRAVDYTKRGLDDYIERRMRAGKMGKAEARALRTKLNEVLEKVDASNPEYAAARKQFGDDSRLIEAHEEGTAFSKTDPDEVARGMARRGDEANQMYRSGAHDDLVNAIENRADGRDVTYPLASSEMKRRRMNAVLPSDEARTKLASTVEREKGYHATRSFVTGGSPTARIQAEQTDLGDGGVGAALQIARSPMQGALAALQAAAARGRGLTEGTANALSPRLTAGASNRMTLLEMLNELQGFHTHQIQGSARRGTLARLLDAEAGSAAGSTERHP